MKISTYDRFQALLRVPGFIEQHRECKTVGQLISAIERECNIESEVGSPWVHDLIAQAKRRRITHRS